MIHNETGILAIHSVFFNDLMHDIFQRLIQTHKPISIFSLCFDKLTVNDYGLLDSTATPFITNPFTGGGGAFNFFQVGVCGLDFRSVGLAN